VQTPGPRIEVSLSLSPDADLPAGTRVFVSVQGIGQAGPPLAAKLLSVGDLPSIVSLTDADAVGPFNLSSATEAVVVATISMAGSADVQSGDLQARSAQFSMQGQQEPVRLQLQIRDVIP
jgi:cytochrome c-type biogenesis protein CcmH